MSFEGYYQVLCVNGHYDQVDVYLSGQWKCTNCGADPIWQNLVDETNGGEEGRISVDDFPVLAEDVEEECPTCKHVKLISEATYGPPNDKY